MSPNSSSARLRASVFRLLADAQRVSRAGLDPVLHACNDSAGGRSAARRSGHRLTVLGAPRHPQSNGTRCPTAQPSRETVRHGVVDHSAGVEVRDWLVRVLADERLGLTGRYLDVPRKVLRSRRRRGSRRSSAGELVICGWPDFEKPRISRSRSTLASNRARGPAAGGTSMATSSDRMSVGCWSCTIRVTAAVTLRRSSSSFAKVSVSAICWISSRKAFNLASSSVSMFSTERRLGREVEKDGLSGFDELVDLLAAVRAPSLTRRRPQPCLEQANENVGDLHELSVQDRLSAFPGLRNSIPFPENRQQHHVVVLGMDAVPVLKCLSKRASSAQCVAGRSDQNSQHSSLERHRRIFSEKRPRIGRRRSSRAAGPPPADRGSVAYRIVAFREAGAIVKRRLRRPLTLAYGEILTGRAASLASGSPPPRPDSGTGVRS